MSRRSSPHPTLALTAAGEPADASIDAAITKPLLASRLTAGVLPQPVKLDSVEIQHLWLALLKRPWTSLVLASANPDGSSWEVAEALAEIGQMHRGRPIKLMDAEGATLTESAALVAEMTGHAAAGKPVLVAVGSLVENLAGVHLARAADAVLVCVTLGTALFTNAKRAVELIGSEKIIGCVALRRG